MAEKSKREIIETALLLEALQKRVEAMEAKAAETAVSALEQVRAQMDELRAAWKADVDRLQRRIEFLDDHVTANNVRSLTIRLGQMETNLSTIRENIDRALLGLHRAPNRGI